MCGICPGHGWPMTQSSSRSSKSEDKKHEVLQPLTLLERSRADDKSFWFQYIVLYASRLEATHNVWKYNICVIATAMPKYTDHSRIQKKSATSLPLQDEAVCPRTTIAS